MKATDNISNNFQDPGEGYESHLFEFVLKHVREDESLDPRIAESIAENLLQDHYYGQYYLKVRELESQGLFHDSYTYAQYLMEKEGEQPQEESEIYNDRAEEPNNQRFLRREPWRNIAAAILVVVITALVTYQFSISDDQIAGIPSSNGGEGRIKSLGGDETATNVISFTLDEEIRHNSVLQNNYVDPVFCKMHLVFKGITKDESGFIVRSKRRGTGDEDPFMEELVVRFSDSGKKAEITQSLITSLKNREFPEYIVRGLYEFGEDHQGKLPLLTIYELMPVE